MGATFGHCFVPPLPLATSNTCSLSSFYSTLLVFNLTNFFCETEHIIPSTVSHGLSGLSAPPSRQNLPCVYQKKLGPIMKYLDPPQKDYQALIFQTLWSIEIHKIFRSWLKLGQLVQIS